jgi:hypothetical protein
MQLPEKPEPKAFFKNIVRSAAETANFANGDPYTLENFEPFIEKFVFEYQNLILKKEKEGLKKRLEIFGRQ